MDIILERLFGEKERLERAISHGLDKHIDKASLRPLTNPDTWANVYLSIKNGTYKFSPPHESLVAKDNGEYRIVYILEDVDRILMSMYNDLIFEMCPQLVHPRCKSYKKGVGCGKVVQEAVATIKRTADNHIGIKADLSKYFDSVPIKEIDHIFELINTHCGRSAMTDTVQRFYHQNLCVDLNGNLVEHYFSLGQGIAFASFLADALLYEVDKEMAERDDIYYVRYSDDILLIGDGFREAFDRFSDLIKNKGLTLNPKKVELLQKDKFFTFLGFSIRGKDISLSKNRLKTFVETVRELTVKNPKKRVKDVFDWLYIGDGEYSWATNVLGIINIEEDVKTLDEFVKDNIRAMQTGRRHIGGLGYEPNRKCGVVTRGRGRNVSSNRERTDEEIKGYISLVCMRKNLLISKSLFNTCARQFDIVDRLKNIKAEPCTEEKLLEAYDTFKMSMPCESFNQKTCPFQAEQDKNMSLIEMVKGADRQEALKALETALAGFRLSGWKYDGWFKQFDNGLILLNNWF